MQGAHGLAAVAAATTFLMSWQAHAIKPPRDYFLDPPAAGLWAHIDAVTLGVQASLEHRHEVDGDLTMLTTRLSGLASLGYADAAASADFRIALFTFGGSVGYRDVWRNYPVPRGQQSTRDVRLKLDKPPENVAERLPYERGSKVWPWAEGRLRLVIPLESLWFVSNAAVRVEDGQENGYDWFHTNVHDGGTLWRADATLFFRHERFGAIGPAVRYMSLPRDGKHESEVAFGFTFGTRPGLIRGRPAATDLLLFQFLTVPGNEEFGFHVLRAPLYTMLIYRVSFGVSLPERKF